MAKTPSTYTVKYGDTLWDIALRYLGSGTKYQYLADINGIEDPNNIHVGQKIKLTKDSSGTSTSSTSNVTITAFGVMSTDDNTLFATWTWALESKTESYKVRWEYCGEDGIYFVGSDTTITVDGDYYAASRQSTYSIPTNAMQVRFKIKPITKTYGSAVGTQSYFTASWTDWKYYNVVNPIKTPSAPTVEIDKNNKLTATIENMDTEATKVVFEIVQNDTVSIMTGSSTVNADFKQVSYSYNVSAGNEYKVRCRLIRNKLGSDWSPFSSNVQALPSVPASITQCKASGKTTDGYSVYLEWASVKSAETYNIEYTNHKEYFDNAGDTTKVSTTDASNQITLYKLTGGEYFFRVQAVNSKGSSDWSEIASVKIGEPPAAPTTWSSTTTVVAGEPLYLYWMHNSEDGSNQTWAQIELDVDGDVETHEVKNTSEEETTSVYEVDTSKYSEGTTIKWRVRTSGVTNILGTWSIQRSIDIYAPATIDLTVTNRYTIQEDGSVQLLVPENGTMDTLTSFPFYLKAVPGPNSQAPVGYHVSITSNETYETIDNVGLSKIVSAGEQVYSKYFDISTVLLVEFSAGNLDLENGVEYTITCTVSMNSGLSAEASTTFTVSWTDARHLPNAEISINPDIFSASIRPYCNRYETSMHKVVNVNGKYTTTDELDISMVENVYTETGERVYLGRQGYGSPFLYGISYVDRTGKPINPTYYRVNHTSSQYVVTTSRLNASTISKVFTEDGYEVLLGTYNGADIYYCESEKAFPVDDVMLAVYRREFDGAFTELAKGIDNNSNTFITDPHPALNYARYRIVATTKSTGAVSYYDIPGVPVNGKAIVIQWNESWSSLDNLNEDRSSEPTWSGSMVKLPYNIDINDNNNPDVTQIRYVGRKRPVTYYGTQLGESSSWSTVIPKNDEETVYLLRKLAAWMGDVYVREPSGTGYWASVRVSFGTKHRDVTIPVTLDITRVEGGV